jgi:heme oxygenase (biliverdin-IX-beta and delta-forming)
VTAGIVREKLRAATAAAHERLHQHPGLSAAACGAIGIDAYRALLARLYGFHKAFDDATLAQAVLTPAPRSRLLEDDLQALGVSPEQLAALPLCDFLSPLTEEASALGALYVVEGSALGGARIARALAPVLEPFRGAGCRFFSNDGGARGAFPGLLARIETLHDDPHRERAAIDAAVRTFAAFEDWMTDWAQEATTP